MRRRAAVFVAVLAAGPAAAQDATLPPPAPVWRVEIAAPGGWTGAFDQAVAVRADGAALIVAAFEGKAEKDGAMPPRRYALVGVDAGGRVLWRHALPLPDGAEKGFNVALAVLGPGADYTVAWSDHRHVRVFRVGAGGVSPLGGPTLTSAQRRLRHGEPAEFQLSGLTRAPDGRLALYGGTDMGPHAPWLAVLDPRARLVWEFRGRHAMPPGGVFAARFVAGGAVETVTVDREESFFERRNAAGALTARTRLGTETRYCTNFVGDGLAGIAYGREGDMIRAVMMDLAGRPRGAVDLPKAQGDGGGCVVVPVAADVAILGEARARRALYLDTAGRPRGHVDLAPVGVAEFDHVSVQGRHWVRISRPSRAPAIPVSVFRLPEPALAPPR
jgi:hypothetical protein